MLEGFNMKGVSRIQITDVNFTYDQLFFLKDKERKGAKERNNERTKKYSNGRAFLLMHLQ